MRIRELAKLEKFRREFIADVSHEIKTPLSGILGAVDLLRKQGSGNRDQGMVKRLVNMIEKESKRLNGLVQSILDLARLEREGDVLDITEFDLEGMLKDLAAKYGVRYAGSDKRENSVLGDATLIVQAVSNLVENAKRHSGTDDIVLSLTWFDGCAHVIVEDHGVGIPPEHAARVFERFHRIAPARAAVVFAPPGLVGDAVDPGKVPQRNPAASADVAVPCDSQCFAFPVGQSVPGCLVYAILSFAHDVGFAYLG